MPGKSSTIEATTIWKGSVDWPIELVPVQLEVVVPRRLTALEWAVLAVLDEFGDEVPPLAEVVQELGLGESVFLLDTIRAVERLAAVERRPVAYGATDQLQQLRLTERGRELFRRGQIEGEPAVHGVTMAFDALTDCSMACPRTLRSRPRCPVVDESQLPEPRVSVGLDRARQVVARHHAALVAGDGHVRTAMVLDTDEPEYADLDHGFQWSEVGVELEVQPGGTVDLKSGRLSKEAHRVLVDTLLAGAEVIDWTALVASQLDFRPDTSSRGRSWDDVAGRAKAVLPPAGVGSRCLRLVQQARTEVVVTSDLVEGAGLKKELDRAVGRGCRVLVVGSDAARVAAWRERKDAPPGILVEVGSGASGPALIVDEGAGVEVVPTRVVFEGVSVVAQLAVELGREGALPTRTRLVEALSSSAPPAEGATVHEDPMSTAGARFTLARLAFTGAADAWPELIRRVVQEEDGVAAVCIVARAARLAEALAPSHAAPSWREDWGWRWRTACSNSLIEEADELCALVEAAPDHLEAAEAMTTLVEACAPLRPVQTDAASIERLAALGKAATLRWGAAEVQSCPAYTGAVGACLVPDPGQALLPKTLEWVVWAAGEDRAQEFALDLCIAWGEPDTVDDVPAWWERQQPLQALLGGVLADRGAATWRHLAPAAARTRGPEVALRAAEGILPMATAASALIDEGPSGSTEAALAWIRQVAEATWRLGAPMDQGDLRRAVSATLPVPEGGYHAAEHAEMLGRVVDAVEGWPDGRAALAEWAARLAASIPRAASLAGVPWWVEAHGGLGSVPGVQVAALLTKGLRPFRRDLVGAREREEESWQLTLAAWRDLRLDETVLASFLDEGDDVRSGGGGRRGKKKKRRRRK